jgi:CARDB
MSCTQPGNGLRRGVRVTCIEYHGRGRIRLRLTAVVIALASVAGAWGAAPAGADTVYITANNQQRELRNALNTPGTIVRVGNHVRLDLSLHPSMEIQQGVQLLGGRTSEQPGPLLFTRYRPDFLFLVRGDGVRISGLRIRGPDFGVANGSGFRRGILAKDAVELEIDHNEISGFQGMGVEIKDPNGRIGTVGLPRVRVHDNFIHHIRHVGKLGYGIAVKDGAFVWIERNVFDYNRHAIEGDGDPATGYLAYDNLVLARGGEHRRIPIYGWVYTHQFDMHGSSNCGISSLFSDSVWNCGTGGHHIDIRHNSFLYTRAAAVKIRGTPVERPCGATIHYNTFRHRSIGSAVQRTRRGVCRAANQLGYTPRVRACLIDGDDQLDNFLPTGRTWWYQHSRRMHWTFIRRTTDVPANCPPPPPPTPTEIPPAPPPPPPATGTAPDLAFSSFTLEQYTVTNQGTASAGPFRVSVVSATSTTHDNFSGLAPGQSATMSYTRGCEAREARADTLNQVSETNETNNIAGPIGPQIC